MVSYVFRDADSFGGSIFVIGHQLRGVLNPTFRYFIDFGGSKVVLLVFLDKNSLGGNIFVIGPQFRGAANPHFMLLHRYRCFKGGFICI